MTESTTIKVPKALRETVMRSARAEGLTAAQFVELATTEHTRRRRFDAVRAAYAGGIDRDYDEITLDWNQADNDGLDS